MENNIGVGLAISGGEGLLVWGASKLIRGAVIKAKANRILNNLPMLQMGFGSGNEYNEVVITTKLLNIIVPALIGIATGIGAVAAELHGDHNVALGLAGVAVPHIIELFTNKK